MASASYGEDLTCSICLTFFSDPVVLLCGHSFCRECIRLSLSTQQQCPQCRADIPGEANSLPTNHSLKNLVEREVDKLRREQEKVKEVDEWLCHEHEERLKLFCVTDQQLVCIICRDGEKHQGHKFKPLKEAAPTLREELESYVQHIADDINATERLANTQREEMAKSKDKAQRLETQISRQFKEMHQFLRKREDEIKTELKHKAEAAVEKMSDTLSTMQTALSESRVLEAIVASVLEIADSERFVKSWTESYSTVTLEHLFRPRADELQVVNASLNLGPYESHLQFFMWKEMLQVIHPRAELLSLKTKSAGITISEDRRSLICTPKRTPPQSKPILDPDLIKLLCQTKPPPSCGTTRGMGQIRIPPLVGLFGEPAQTSTPPNHPASSVNEFSSGQHYWEVDVGHRDYWELGIKDHFLKCDGRKYSTSSLNVITELWFTGRSRKIGIYLDCSSKKLTFYNADTMSHIYTVSCGVLSPPLSAHFSIRYTTPDPNPMTVCWY